MIKFMVWNNIDHLYASDELFDSVESANLFIESFKQRFRSQGYYFTFDCERISLDLLDLEVVTDENY